MERKSEYKELAPDEIIHKYLMKIIPWKIWNYRWTSRLMRINYWANKKEFDQLRFGDKNE